MEVKNKRLYHIHRNYNMDNLWNTGSSLLIDNNFQSVYFAKLLVHDNELKERYGSNYDIDFIIAMMEEMIFKGMLDEEAIVIFNRLKVLRREQALEEGRKLYNPSAPQRFHSIYLTDKEDLEYWKECVGDNCFKEYLLEISGNLFKSSDTLFPDESLMLDRQIEESKKYWNPTERQLLLRKEYLFQGQVQIIK